jgi:hypothetical protein
MNNFNIEKIIHINHDIYYYNINRDITSISHTMKNCILKIKNLGKTSKIIVSKISLNENKIVENHIIDINTINDNFSFYYKDYNNKVIDSIIDNVITSTLSYVKVKDIFNISYKNHEKLIIDPNEEYLILNNNIIEIKKLDVLNNLSNQILLYEKEKSSNLYYKFYLEYIIKKNLEDFKGINNQFNISKIEEQNIPILSNLQQTTIINYIACSKNLIDANHKNINTYIELKCSILDNIPINNFVILDDIIEIIDKNIDKILISVTRNSLCAGTVSLYQDTTLVTLNNNSFFLNIKNENFILKYIYHYLKYKETYIKELSNLTQQPNLNKTNLINIQIPNINRELQEKIINLCDEFDNNINTLLLNNNMIKDKDIFNIITQFNMDNNLKGIIYI